MAVNVLIASRDERLLLQIKAVRESLAKEFQFAVAFSEDAARQCLEQSRVNVLLCSTDIDGDVHQLVQKCMQDYPNCIRIVHCPTSELEDMWRSFHHIHHIMDATASDTAMQTTLRRMVELRTYLQNTAIDRVVQRIPHLPSAPKLYEDVNLLLHNPRTSVRDLAKTISQDRSISSSVLETINSAFMSEEYEVKSIQQAIAYVGISTVQCLLLATDVFLGFDEGDPSASQEILVQDRVQRHAVRVGVLARSILKDNPVDREHAFAAGLIHDIGQLLLATYLPIPFRAAQRISKEQGIPLHQAEESLYGITHADLGAYILARWGVPYVIVEAVAFHHVPSKMPTPQGLGPCAAVHIADVLIGEGRADLPFDLNYLKAHQLEDKIPLWRSTGNEVRKKVA